MSSHAKGLASWNGKCRFEDDRISTKLWAASLHHLSLHKPRSFSKGINGKPTTQLHQPAQGGFQSSSQRYVRAQKRTTFLNFRHEIKAVEVFNLGLG